MCLNKRKLLNKVHLFKQKVSKKSVEGEVLEYHWESDEGYERNDDKWHAIIPKFKSILHQYIILAFHLVLSLLTHDVPQTDTQGNHTTLHAYRCREIHITSQYFYILVLLVSCSPLGMQLSFVTAMLSYSVCNCHCFVLYIEVVLLKRCKC